ncbi:MAG: hypothetical protein KDJ16_09895, partial [Hyphomicrobiales bacterium]|nr:hypothetical protein [Hyphomicrobiales bacterium]
MTQSRHTHWRTTLPARSSSPGKKHWRGAAIAGFTALVAAGAAFGLLAVPTVAVADNAEAAV